jgi:hypothetical protein
MIEDTIRIHSLKINRIIRIEDGIWKTKYLYGYNLNTINFSKGTKEFELIIKYKEKLVHLTNEDLNILEYKIGKINEELFLEVKFIAKNNKNFFVYLFYSIDNIRDVLIKQIQIENLTKTPITVVKIAIESLCFKSEYKGGGIGQPILTQGYFWVIEDPIAKSQYNEKTLTLWHFPNEVIYHNQLFKSKMGILGSYD